jgi:plastocyanin
MRRILPLALLVALLAAAAAVPASAGAAIFGVRIDDTRYSRSLVNARIGDRIRYSWNTRNTAEHDAVVTTRPRNGTRFRSPLKVKGTPYLTPALRVAGRYTVICTIHGFSMRISVTRPG